MTEPKQANGEKKHGRKISPVLRVSAFLLVVVLIAGAGTAINATWRTQAKSWEVYLDGELVGVVTEEDRDLLIESVDAAVEQAKIDNELDVVMSNKIEFAEVLNNDRDELEAVREEILGKLEFGLIAAAILVDGEEVVMLACAEDAHAILLDLQERFINNNVLVVEKVDFQESVEVVEKYVEPDKVTDKETALNILLHGSEKILQHIVTRGETFWTIANQYRLSVSVIQSANPNIRPEALPIGARLNLKIDEPYIRVEYVEQIKYSQSIPFPTTYVTDNSLWKWQTVVRTRGKPGSQEVVARVVSVNGKEASREIISSTTVAQPSAQVVARGTKSAPSASSGSFMWPATGSITSPFGPRWGGYHQGVDIGASSGAAIKAADSGVVSFAGWNGGYGYMVKIEHGGGSSTLYAHASRLLVTQNQKVTKGDTIALVGNTGNSYGAHLHFEIRINDKPVNPLNYFR